MPHWQPTVIFLYCLIVFYYGK